MNAIPEIDKFARDGETWRRDAEATFAAATLLFYQGPGFWFSAAILGHHALEMLLKSALIQEGYMVRKGKPQDGCVWGHNLTKLARLLSSKRQGSSMSLITNLARYDAFFGELRYPRGSPNVDHLGPGSDEAALLDDLMDGIRPFAFPLSQPYESQ